MSYVERFPERPLFCTCEATWDRWPDRLACTKRALQAHGYDPHPVLEIEDIRKMREVVASLYPPLVRSSDHGDEP